MLSYVGNVGGALIKMSMYYWWQNANKISKKDLKTYLSQCYFVHEISHMDRPGIKPTPPQWQADG